ncbi:G5 domain-containing protein [Streptococcus suis]|uniref:LPXTG cell wall surface protein n=1 Tax=Streptococcus suis TaxID=1307 RepID=A0AB33U1K8_STRSU|nr:G5 domain-containing protein [Streptococcus suis]NQH86271.1 LPXTG cell wall anchor domain-containing protein [Streptococcus suis]NQN17713.1 LPXTG cell wall anchor domain-containing protein [Streptococcus suis]NQP10784.1 LPXTG cell wall anchor domain-containing protein [Streptococcus suis]NQR70809.1 LPXTG cell wall anchor domain-containing protein [Streptococcus suis]CYU23572.1 LPXTG cell wall surface protein [Streptococcus suis]
MVYSRTQRIQEEKKQRLRYGIRKFTGLGAASALLGVGLLTSLSVHAQTKTAEVRYDYVTTEELTEVEKKAIFTELPAQVTEDVNYYLVYRKVGSSILPQTGESTGVLAGAIGAGLLLVGITVGRKNQRLVRSAMTLTLVGGSLVFTSVSAVTVAQLAQYGQTQTLTVGAALPDGKISIAGYEFVGYLEGKKQSSETSPTLPTGSIDKAEENENLPVQPTQPVDENKSDIPAESTPSEDKVTDASAEQKPSEDKVEEVPVESKPAEKPVEETGSGQVIGTEDKVISETEKPVQPEIPAPVEKPAVPGETETTVIPGEEKTVSPELPTNPAEPDRPVDTVRTDVEKQVTVIKYGTSYVKDTSLPAGESKVLTQGVDGKQTVTTKVTYTNNVETAREIVATETIEPVTEVIAYNDEVSKNREELIESLTTVSFATERRANADLEVGSERVLVAGVNGQTKTLTKKVYDSTGAVISEEVVSTEVVTQPVTQVIEYGTKPKSVVETTEETKVTELDYTVETRQNPDLEKGQTRTLTKGRKGTLTQTYRITKTNGNETARELVKEERVEPVNEIIEVGTKAVVRYQTRQETSVIPFTTETRQVDSLFEGESRELVAGVDGQQTQTYKDTYVDGVKVASEMVGQPEVIQPIKRIVEVGIKKEETSQVLTETEVLAYTSIKEEDPNLPEGETKIKVQGVNGERKVRITRVTNNRTGQVSETREVISETAPVNEVLVVGTKPASTSLLDKKTLTLDEFMSLTEEQQDAFIAKKGTVPGTTIRTGATKDTLEKVESLINLDKLNAEFVNLLNAARAAEGLSAVTYAGQGSDAQNAATTRANEMADHGSLRYQGTADGAHKRPDGSKWTTVYTAEQTARQGWRGENALQLGTALSASKASDEIRVANSLFDEWMRSAGHKAVMMKNMDNLQVAVGIGLNDKAIENTFRDGVTVAMLELVQPKP